MANIPSHMRLPEALEAPSAARRGSTAPLLMTGFAIGLIAAALALLAGLVH